MRARTPRAQRNSPSADFCLTPSAGRHTDYSPAGCRRPGSAVSSGAASRRGGAWGQGGGWEEHVRESPATDDFEQYGRESAFHDLALQNSRLKQKLGRTRAKSQERACRAERTVEKLGAENAALQRECESLRALFIRQQQQQIAFWTGPFMDMLAPNVSKECAGNNSVSDDLAKSLPADPWAAAATAAATAAAAAAVVTKPSGGCRSVGGGAPPQTPPQYTAKKGDPGEAVSRTDSVRALSRERDYWRLMATELREMHSSTSRSGGRRSSGGSALRDGDDLSTSMTQSQGQDLEGSSECSDTAPGNTASMGYSCALSSSASSLPGTSAVCGGGFSNGGQWQCVEGRGGHLSNGSGPGSRYPTPAAGGA